MPLKESLPAPVARPVASEACTAAGDVANDAVSLPPAWITGFTSSMNGSSSPAARRVSCDFIQLALPVTVLISPLCASIRNGCASFQVGKVLVE